MEKVSLRRRDFVLASLASAGTLVCTGLGMSSACAGEDRRGRGSSHKEFAKHVGTRFRFVSEGGRPVDMKLIETKELPLTSRERARHVCRKPFSVEFRADAPVDLPQETYVVRHRQMGTFKLFVVPVGPEPGHYEAIFS